METLKAWVGYGAPAPKTADEVKNKNEFIKIRFKFIDKTMGDFVDEYPLQALVYTVVFFVLGLAAINLSLSLLAAATLIGLSVCMGTAIYRKGWAAWTGAWGTIQILMAMNTEANKAADATKAKAADKTASAA